MALGLGIRENYFLASFAPNLVRKPSFDSVPPYLLCVGDRSNSLRQCFAMANAIVR